MISPEYLAGLFDGEGCLYSAQCGKKGSRNFYLYAALTNTHLPVLKQVQIEYGGSVSRKIDKRRVEIAKARYNLVWSGNRQVEKLLNIIGPYLIIKKEQAELVLNEWLGKAEGVSHVPVTNEQKTLRQELHLKLQALKRIEFVQ